MRRTLIGGLMLFALVLMPATLEADTGPPLEQGIEQVIQMEQVYDLGTVEARLAPAFEQDINDHAIHTELVVYAEGAAQERCRGSVGHTFCVAMVGAVWRTHTTPSRLDVLLI